MTLELGASPQYFLQSDPRSVSGPPRVDEAPRPAVHLEFSIQIDNRASFNGGLEGSLAATDR